MFRAGPAAAGQASVGFHDGTVVRISFEAVRGENLAIIGPSDRRL